MKGQDFLKEQLAGSSILKSFDLLMIMKLVVTSSVSQSPVSQLVVPR